MAAIETLYPQTDIRLDSAAVPNPFFGVAPDVYPDADQTILTLVDGGMDGEVTPYQPLLVKARGVDTIFARSAISSGCVGSSGSAERPAPSARAHCHSLARAGRKGKACLR